MLDLVQPVLKNQFGGALGMLDACLEQCADSHWGETVVRFPFWHVAYHILFYTDLYLSPNEEAFRLRPFAGENDQIFGRRPWPPFDEVKVSRTYDRATLREYVRLCQAKADEILGNETEQTLAGPSGFFWLPITRLELHVYNVRHVQHHTGQLSATLCRVQGRGCDWIGTRAPLSG